MAYHNKYHTTDYTDKWTPKQNEVLLLICQLLREREVKKKDWWVRCGIIIGRSAESCRHKYRTLIARSDRVQVGGGLHRWTPKEIAKVNKLLRAGVSAPEIARLLGITKYAVWHKTKGHSQ